MPHDGLSHARLQRQASARGHATTRDGLLQRQPSGRHPADADRAASALASVLLCASLLYNLHVWQRWRQLAATDAPGGQFAASSGAPLQGAGFVLAHLLLELAFGAACAGHRYRAHRVACLMAARTVLLLLMSHYVPSTFDHTFLLELREGRGVATTWRTLSSFPAIHAIEITGFALPLPLAAPYHAARLAATLAATLPATLAALARHPDALRTACRAWGGVGAAYAAAAHQVLGSHSGAGDDDGGWLDCEAAEPAALLHAALALLVYLQSCVVLVALYVLALQQDREAAAAAASAAASEAAADSSFSSSSAGSSLRSGAGSSSSSSLDSGDGAGASSSSGARARRAPLAAAVGDSLQPLERRGLPWPAFRHFTATMHASLLVAGTSALWAAALLLSASLQAARYTGWPLPTLE